MSSPAISNAIQNNVLCYLTSARHTLSRDSIVSACLAFYGGDEIVSAKEIVFTYANETVISRRGKSKVSADITDILELLRRRNEDNFEFPKFLADGYGKMPPSAGFEVIAEHIVGLINELQSVKVEIAQLKELNSHHINNDVTDVKEDLRDIKMTLRELKPVAVSPTDTSRNSNLPKNDLSNSEVGQQIVGVILLQ